MTVTNLGVFRKRGTILRPYKKYSIQGKEIYPACIQFVGEYPVGRDGIAEDFREEYNLIFGIRTYDSDSYYLVLKLECLTRFLKKDTFRKELEEYLSKYPIVDNGTDTLLNALEFRFLYNDASKIKIRE